MSASPYYLAQFLVNPEKAEYGISQLESADIKPRSVEVSVATTPLYNCFARIYYCSDGFDLGTPPKFELNNERSYATDAVAAATYAVFKLMSSNPSMEGRARAVHDALSHNYLEWAVRGKAEGRHHLIVPFEALPPYEKKKRYFAAEVAATIAYSPPTYEEHERFIASQMIDLATYHVAYDLLRNHNDPVLDPNALIEAFEGASMSESTLH